jgi:hypothetical protein
LELIFVDPQSVQDDGELSGDGDDRLLVTQGTEYQRREQLEMAA